MLRCACLCSCGESEGKRATCCVASFPSFFLSSALLPEQCCAGGVGWSGVWEGVATAMAPTPPLPPLAPLMRCGRTLPACVFGELGALHALLCCSCSLDVRKSCSPFIGFRFVFRLSSPPPSSPSLRLTPPLLPLPSHSAWPLVACVWEEGGTGCLHRHTHTHTPPSSCPSLFPFYRFSVDVCVCEPPAFVANACSRLAHTSRLVPHARNGNGERHKRAHAHERS